MAKLQSCALWLGALSGWRRVVAAVLLGAVATLALPPFKVALALLPAFSGLVFLLGGAKRARCAFALGWWFGFGHLSTGLYWIANALSIDAARFWWMVPFALFALPAFLALFCGGSTLVAWGVCRGWRAERRMFGLVLALAAAWTLGDYARGHLLTGFPWNLPGYVWVESLAMLQGAAWFGIYGLSLLTLLLAASPAALVAPRGGWLCAAILILGTGLAGAGAVRLQENPPIALAGITLRLVQPNIPQSLKWQESERAANFHKHLALSAKPAERPLTAVIWSESATAFPVENVPQARAMIAQIAPPGGVVITGTLRLLHDDKGQPQVWNSLVALDGDGSLRAAYDKFHLVPFGEYIPARNLLPVERIVPGGMDFSAGPGPRSLRLPGLPPVGPLICYEVVFPGAVTDPLDRPLWLLNLTNDGWYGFSSGPFQHFAISSVRAVEEGMPLVRVAGSGISGVVDSFGRVTARLGLSEEGILDVSLPQALERAPAYGRWGDVPVLLVSAFLLIGVGFRRTSYQERTGPLST